MSSKIIIGAIILILIIGGGILFLNRTKAPSQTQAPSSTQSETQNTITFTKSGFSPDNLTIKVGTRVNWKNDSGGELSVNSNPHPQHTDYSALNIGEIEKGESKGLVFDKAGTFGYHNHYNPSQKGTIIVE